MAKIENTSAYPSVLPTSSDYFIITDASDDNKTKTCTVDSLQSYFGNQTLELTVPSTELLALFTNPKVLIPSPGAGVYIMITGFSVFRMDAGAVAYDFPANVQITTTSMTTPYYNLTPAILNASTDITQGYGVLASPLTIYDDEPLLLKGLTGNATVGDGELKLSIRYRLVTI